MDFSSQFLDCMVHSLPLCLHWENFEIDIWPNKSKSLGCRETNHIPFESPDMWLLLVYFSVGLQPHRLSLIRLHKRPIFHGEGWGSTCMVVTTLSS